MKPGTPWRPFVSPMPPTGRQMKCPCHRGGLVDHDTWYTDHGPITMSEERCVLCQRVVTQARYHRIERHYL